MNTSEISPQLLWRQELYARIAAIQQRLPCYQTEYEEHPELSPCGTASGIVLFGSEAFPTMVSTFLDDARRTFLHIAERQHFVVHFPTSFRDIDRYIHVPSLHGLIVFTRELHAFEGHIYGMVNITPEQIPPRFLTVNIQPKNIAAERSWDFIKGAILPNSSNLFGLGKPGVMIFSRQSPY